MDNKETQKIWRRTPNKGILPAEAKHRMWLKIQKETTQRNKRHYRWAAAAAIVFLVSFAGYQSFLGFSTPKTEVIITQTFPNDVRLLRLPDGTRIWVNQNTKIEYPDQFTGNIRNVTLHGEAYFEVAKDPSKPFVITSGDITTTVIGTSFTIKAYKGTGPEVRVRTGKVKVEGKENTVFLEKGFAAISNKSEDKTLQKQKIVLLEPEWKKALLDIDGLTLGQVVDKLQKEHHFKIDYATKDLSQLKIKGSLDTRQGFAEMLHTVAFALNLELKATDKNHYLFSR